jgi:hypothetical protein
MAALYWFALIVGGGVLVASLLRGLREGGGGQAAGAGHLDAGGVGATGGGEGGEVRWVAEVTE